MGINFRTRSQYYRIKVLFLLYIFDINITVIVFHMATIETFVGNFLMGNQSGKNKRKKGEKTWMFSLRPSPCCYQQEE